MGAILAGRASAADSLVLADPAAPLEPAWTHRRFVGATDYAPTVLDGVRAIRAVGRHSASGLYRPVGYRVAAHPWLTWRWRVDKLQPSADIRVKEREDFAAAVFVIFGDPSRFDPEAPTLAYVWTSDRVPAGAILRNPHRPGSLRDIVLRSGPAQLGQWVQERRNLAADFRTAFGRDPPDTVGILALFTDNDQTGEPVEAYYGTITAEAE